MYNTEFTSWLAGYVLLGNPKTLSQQQRDCIRKHARLCEYVENGKLTVTNFVFLNDMDRLDDDLIFAHAVHQYRCIPAPTSNELCYFLQGVFEIGDVHVWDRDVAELCMEEMDRNVHGLDPELLKLYYRLKDFLKSEQDSLDLCDVKRDLEGVFQHAIDPSYDVDPSVANAIHAGETAPSQPSTCNTH